MAVCERENSENLGQTQPHVSLKIASSSRTSGEAPAGSASDHDPRGHVAGQPASSFRKKTLCKNCGREITRWFDAEYWIGKPSEQIWTHDDFVDGTEDGHCDGISCKNETAESDATEAQPGPPDFYRPRPNERVA